MVHFLFQNERALGSHLSSIDDELIRRQEPTLKHEEDLYGEILGDSGQTPNGQLEGIRKPTVHGSQSAAPKDIVCSLFE